MGKVAKVVVLLGIIVALGYGLMVWNRSQPTPTAESAQQGEPAVRVEQKYGFTSEGVDGD